MRVIYGPLPQPAENHNGGCLQFGPDSKLYLSLGDGGECCDDPSNRAQDLAQDFGKLLRFDVDIAAPFAPPDNPFVSTPGASPFVWALGLRNPWRFSFDSATGDLWVADVGDQSREEIDYRPAGMAAGTNFGWNCTEGTLCTSGTGCGCSDPDITLPVHEYVTHEQVTPTKQTCAVMGGYVYRGSAIPSLVGRYLFADACSQQVWSLAVPSGGPLDLVDHTAELLPAGGWTITSFGQGADGELYVVDFGGSIWRIDPEDPVATASAEDPAASPAQTPGAVPG
jgi:glucose/arabinose dehydrogenase